MDMKTPDEQEALARALAAMIGAHLSVAAVGEGVVEVEWNGPPRLSLNVPMPVTTILDKEPPVVSLEKLASDMLPGAWGYFNNDPAFQEQDVCLRCGKTF